MWRPATIQWYLCSYIVLLLKDGSIPMVCTWSFSRGDCNITLSTTHGCSNVSIEIIESINLVIILDLIHLASWSDLLSFIKHIYYLPTGGNILGVLKFNLLEDLEAIRCEWWLCVENFGMLEFFSCLTILYVVIVYDGCTILDGILGTQNIIFLVFVCWIRDRSCCSFNSWRCLGLLIWTNRCI